MSAKKSIEIEDMEKKNPPFFQVRESKVPDLRKHLKNNPIAVDIFLFLAQHMGKNNILVCSSGVLIEETQRSKSTVWRALKYLEENELILIVKLGTSNGFAINGDYVWKTFNHPGRYVVFENAKALASKEENKKLAKYFKYFLNTSKVDPNQGSFLGSPEQKDHMEN